MRTHICSNKSSEKSSSSQPVPIVKAEDWFASGRRVPYDPAKKRILSKETPGSLHIWERVVAPFGASAQSRWLTMMPGVPEGSYCFSKIDSLLQTAPRLYIEYVGLGGSDKPSNYHHSVMERANLVEAQWRAHKVRRTVLICQSCSSMVMMELLNRQRERLALGLPVRTRIEHVLSMNGAYFSHTHKPHALNTPLMKHTIGKAAFKAAQHSDCALEALIRGCFSSDYKLTKEEVKQFGASIRQQNGTTYFTSSASRYIEEHKENSDRWNIVNVYNMSRKQGVSFTLVGGDQDNFQSKAFILAKEKLSGKSDIYFEILPGGFDLPLEQPHRIADLVDGVAMAPAFDPVLSTGYVSKRASMASSTESTVSTEASSFSPTASEGWADADFPEIYEYGL